MSNKEMLDEILNDEFFHSSILLTVKTVDYVEGVVSTVSATPVSIDAIVQNVTAKTLENLGLGVYTDKENFSLFTATEIDLSKSNYITYQSKNYKIVALMPWRGYGFRKYIMTQYNGDVLNDN